MARLIQDGAQIFFALAAIGMTIFRGRIVPRLKVRRAAPSLREHLVPIQVEKFSVLLRTPRERVNAIETQNVVDAKKMKAMLDRADTFSPPIEVALVHCRPPIKRNTPVLSPFLGESIVFEMCFRWSAATPIECELLWPGEDVRAVITD